MNARVLAVLLVGVDLVALFALSHAWRENRALTALPEVLPTAFDMSLLTVPDYDPPDLRADQGAIPREEFPAAVQAFHGEEVTARGYPMVLAHERGIVTEFLLTRFPPGCCFGALPVLDEWIHVKLEDGYSAGPPTQAVEVTGVLDVGEKLIEEGLVESLYRMQASKVTLLPLGR